MASEKIKHLLFKKGAPFDAEQMEALSDRAAWAWLYNHSPKDFRKRDLPSVCFTGFTDAQKDALIEEASEFLTVQSSVTKSLSYLILGDFPGPKKLETARALGTVMLSVEQYKHMMSTGEMIGYKEPKPRPSRKKAAAVEPPSETKIPAVMPCPVCAAIVSFQSGECTSCQAVIVPQDRRNYLKAFLSKGTA